MMNSADQDDVPHKRAILREFLETQKAQSKDAKDTIILPQLMQAWDYATETNFDMLLAQVTAQLALSKARILVRYNTNTSEHATASHCVPRKARVLCLVRRVLAILLSCRKTARLSYTSTIII
jgi:hypothetical protein